MTIRPSHGILLGLGLLLGACASTPPPEPQQPASFQAASQAYARGDYDRAFILMRAEAELGDADAQYAIGYMYLHGQGTKPSRQKGLDWIKKSAAQGNQKAIDALGRIAEANGGK